MTAENSNDRPDEVSDDAASGESVSAQGPARGGRMARVAVGFCVLLIVLCGGYLLWSPGLDLEDGRHDLGSNAVWLAHGWLGGDSWFLKYDKTNEFSRYRETDAVSALAERLQAHHISTVYPHLCPTEPNGDLPEVDGRQAAQFLDAMDAARIRVVPWVGGPNGGSVDLKSTAWRSRFSQSIRELLNRHPRLAGVQINIEPLPDGTQEFLDLLVEIKRSLPVGKVLGVAAYPPPTRWHPYPDVHWSEAYFRAVSTRVDELAVMMYDTALGSGRFYQNLMVTWTMETLSWSEGRAVWLGVPTYTDAGVGYHNPAVENLENALAGIHGGLARMEASSSGRPAAYRGVAIYSDWETDEGEWLYWTEHFQKR